MAGSIIAALIIGTLGLISAIGGGVINARAQREANETNLALNESNNKTNVKLAQDEMAFNSAEAQKQRDFELEMSNTAIQRRMADYEAAGVNPMLALGSPAQMASGAAASASTVRTQSGSVEPVTAWGDSLGHIASIAQSSAMMMALSKINTDRANTYAKSRVDAANINAQSRNRGWEQYAYKLQDGSFLTQRKYK